MLPSIHVSAAAAAALCCCCWLHCQAVALTDLLTPMLAWDPSDRPTAAELLSHPYFKPLHNADYYKQFEAQDEQPNSGGSSSSSTGTNTKN
jgi:serine/threonine protein kinase